MRLTLWPCKAAVALQGLPERTRRRSLFLPPHRLAARRSYRHRLQDAPSYSLRRRYRCAQSAPFALLWFFTASSGMHFQRQTEARAYSLHSDRKNSQPASIRRGSTCRLGRRSYRRRVSDAPVCSQVRRLGMTAQVPREWSWSGFLALHPLSTESQHAFSAAGRSPRLLGTLSPNSRRPDYRQHPSVGAPHMQGSSTFRCRRHSARKERCRTHFRSKLFCTPATGRAMGGRDR